jgi:hypothetical protein
MDADDEALPDRLARQISFLERHPEIAVVGTAARVVYPDGRMRTRRRPPNTAAIRRHIVRICPFFHSSVVMRREAVQRVGLYDPTCDGSRGGQRVEDYDLWVRMLVAGCEMANLSEPLMVYNRRPGSILRGRSFARRMGQQVRSRVDAIHRLGLGPLAYTNLLPVILVSGLGGLGIKMDVLFNLLAGRPTRRPGSVRSHGSDRHSGRTM